MLTRDPAAGTISQIGALAQEGSFTRPSTGSVIGAFKDEALYGVGTRNADLLAAEAKAPGEAISFDDWKDSPYFDSEITYYPTMTIDGAIATKEAMDFAKRNAEIISKASAGQMAIGYGAAFAAGMVEPKNLMTGVAASAILTPIGAGGVTGIKSAANLLKLSRRVRRYGDIAARGFGEGLVAAALMEPSNNSSADVLQQEYTLADTLWNVGLSSVLGAGLATAPAIIRDKVRRHKSVAADVIAEEIDLATTQMVEGKKIDVDIVEMNRARPEVAAEQFVRYTETPEFKARFEGSKVVDENGAPLRLYHGTKDDVQQFDLSSQNRQDSGWLGEGVYLTDSTHLADIYARNKKGESAPNIMPLYARIENPLILSQPEGMRLKAKLRDGGKKAAIDYTRELQAKGHDGVIMTVANDAKEYLVFNPDNVISAFGADDLPTIKARMNQETLRKIQESQKPESSIAIDMDGVMATEQRVKDIPQTPDYQKSFDADMERIRNMVDQGILPEDIYTEYLDALDNHNGDDIKEALKTLEGCLLRGGA